MNFSKTFLAGLLAFVSGPLQLKLYYLIVAASESFQTEGVATVSMTNPEVLKAACIIFAAVPIICVYPFIQKYFVQGTMVGAVKG